MWSLVLSVGGGEAQDREGAPGGLGEIQEGSLWEGGLNCNFCKWKEAGEEPYF